MVPSDDTAAIARRKKVRVFLRPGMSISALRNFGAAQSSGRVLVFLDADCTVTPHWLREASRYLDAHDVACFGSAPIVPRNATWVQRTWFLVRDRKPVEDVNWLESMNMFVHREKFISIGGFNEDLVTCEDYDISPPLESDRPHRVRSENSGGTSRRGRDCRPIFQKGALAWYKQLPGNSESRASHRRTAEPLSACFLPRMRRHGAGAIPVFTLRHRFSGPSPRDSLFLANADCPLRFLEKSREIQFASCFPPVHSSQCLLRGTGIIASQDGLNGTMGGSMIDWGFYITLLLLLYAYFGYPLLLRALALRLPSSTQTR
jgi:hypothetical protein